MARSGQSLIRKPKGLILITGPTSSGKTSSLTPPFRKSTPVDKNIITVEDPVEYSLPLINQIQIKRRRRSLNFLVLCGILRQNPDVINDRRKFATRDRDIRGSFGPDRTPWSFRPPY